MKEYNWNYDEQINQDENNLIIPINKNKNKCSCCCCVNCFFYYLFCCCCCNSKNAQNEKIFFIKSWQKYLENENNENTINPFKLLTNLYAHKENVIEELKEIRLNPNFFNITKNRNDLEFYIPQLCTFLIFGAFEQVERLFGFLCNVCFVSVFFAHRFFWFLKTLLGNDENNNSIKHYLLIINAIFKSDNEETNKILSDFHIANSKIYLKLFKRKNLIDLFSNKIENFQINKNDYKFICYNNFINSKKIINDFCNLMLENYNLNKNKDKNNKINFSYDINNDFIIPNNLYISNYGLYSNYNIIKHLNNLELLFEDENEEKDLSDVNLLSFYSNIQFFDDLCKIGCDLITIKPEEQMNYLVNEITKINKILPSNVYLPFIRNSTRNYFICHIPINEIKIFKTKERVPFMLTFELIRIDEIIKKIKKNNFDINDSPIIFQDKNRTFIENNKFSIKDDEENLNDFLLNKNKKERKKSIQKEEKYNLLLKEADIHLSKLITINLLEKKFKNSDNNIIIDNNIIKEDEINTNSITKINNDNEEEDENYYKYKQFKKKISKIPNPNKLSMQSDNNSEEIICTTINKKKSFDDINNKFKNKNILKENIIDNNNIINNNNNEINEFDKKINKLCNIIIEEEENNNIITNQSNNINNNRDSQTVINLSKISTIFGEDIEEQTNRLHINSPFKYFKTFSTFKVIIKYGEDLRQEQFATQLINEFAQIFSVNKIDCWVSSYEIITTGKDCGLVEMIPNSLSLDQLKRKTNLSLRNFYLQYFGNENTQSFKDALKNFIKSLAGYSLVCYFLQIKDRHNGNILIDNKGHLIHIDFGFMLSNAPGKGLKFESAPFKITDEMLELLGGHDSDNFKKYRNLLFKGYKALYDNYDKIVILTEMMYCGHGKNFPCFEAGENTIEQLKRRFKPHENMGKTEKCGYIDDLLENSIDNWTTTCYDRFQYYFQGIFY